MLTILDDKKLSEIEITPSSSCCRRLVFLVSLIVRRAMSRGHSTFSLSRDVNKARSSKAMAKAKAKAKAPSLKARPRPRPKGLSVQPKARPRPRPCPPKARPRPRPRPRPYSLRPVQGQGHSWPDQSNTFSVKHTSPYVTIYICFYIC